MHAMSAEITPMPYPSSGHALRAPIDTLHGVAPARAPIDTMRELPDLVSAHRYASGARVALRRKEPNVAAPSVEPSSVRFRGIPVAERLPQQALRGPSFRVSDHASMQMASFSSGTASLISPWAPARRASRGRGIRAVLLLLAAAGAGFVAVHQLAPMVFG